MTPSMVATYGTPQAWTWNIGVIGMYTSLLPSRRMLSRLAMVEAMARVCRTSWRWVKYTPFGLPVVPVV
ncbi:hypothetical protein D9M73_275830 [compost metagenome]